MRYFLFLALVSSVANAGLIDERFREFFSAKLTRVGQDLRGNPCRVSVSYLNKGRYCFEVKVEAEDRVGLYRLHDGTPTKGRGDCPVVVTNERHNLRVVNRTGWSGKGGSCYSDPATNNLYEIGLNREGQRLAVAVATAGRLDVAPVCFIEP